MKYKYFAQKLKKLRISCGWSQAELAKKTELSSAAISMLEKGDRLPSADTIHLLTDIFGISTEVLMGRRDISDNFLKEKELLAFQDALKLNKNDQQLVLKLIKRLLNK